MFTFIILTIHYIHTTSISQISHSTTWILDLWLTSCPCLTCTCKCWYYYDQVVMHVFFLACCFFFNHVPLSTTFMPGKSFLLLCFHSCRQVNQDNESHLFICSFNLTTHCFWQLFEHTVHHSTFFTLKPVTCLLFSSVINKFYRNRDWGIFSTWAAYSNY